MSAGGGTPTGRPVMPDRPEVFWQLCSTDTKDSKPFYEGQGLEALADALRDLMAWETEHTPEGYTPSGNIAIYWHRDAKAEARDA